MDIIQVFLLSILQGLTEFLPISSSAHLILFSESLFNIDQGIFFDVSVHLGTLMAAVIYFRKDLKDIVSKVSLDHFSYLENRLLCNIVVALLPILVVGYIFRDLVEEYLRTREIIAYATIGFGVLLFISDHYGNKKKTLSSLNLFQALIIGLFQCLALIPGTSRSGITITAGLFLGLKGNEAARFSFLLAIPTIGLITIAELINTPLLAFLNNFSQNFFACFIAFVTAYFTIDIFLKLINRVGFTPFVIYRILLGLLILIFWV
tara:strand:- start:3853 stop:4641 length:789 start_codon:yes stop_codon:yes gene_type:complete